MKHRLVALYGGSFDPVHNAHVALVQSVLDGLLPDSLRILPCHIPPHKAPLQASTAQRLAMLRLVFSGLNKVVIDERELVKSEPSYTYYSVDEIRRELGADVRLFLVLGMDSWSSFMSWNRWQDILSMTNVLIVNRPGVSPVAEQPLADYWQDNHIEVHQKNDHACGKVLHLSMPPMPISATKVRSAVVSNERIGHMVPPCIATYIREKALYLK